MISHTTERFRKAFAELPKEVQQENEIIWFWIGSHDDYIKLLSQIK